MRLTTEQIRQAHRAGLAAGHNLARPALDNPYTAGIIPPWQPPARTPAERQARAQQDRAARILARVWLTAWRHGIAEHARSRGINTTIGTTN